MWYNLLAGAADKYREVPIGEAALYALLGFSIVFLGIAFLILVVWAVGKLMNKTPRPKEKEESVSPMIVEEKSEDLTEETIAVITAAIMAYYQQNNPKCEFTVKRIKRI